MPDASAHLNLRLRQVLSPGTTAKIYIDRFTFECGCGASPAFR